MTTQTIQSVREELEKAIRKEKDEYLNFLYRTKLEGFNLGVSLARQEFLELIKQKLQLCYSHKEAVSEILKSLSEGKQ